MEPSVDSLQHDFELVSLVSRDVLLLEDHKAALKTSGSYAKSAPAVFVYSSVEDTSTTESDIDHEEASIQCLRLPINSSPSLLLPPPTSHSLTHPLQDFLFHNHPSEAELFSATEILPLHTPSTMFHFPTDPFLPYKYRTQAEAFYTMSVDEIQAPQACPIGCDVDTSLRSCPAVVKIENVR